MPKFLDYRGLTKYDSKIKEYINNQTIYSSTQNQYIVYVDKNKGNDIKGDGSRFKPYATIQAALNKANTISGNSGQRAGVYVLDAGIYAEDLTFNPKVILYAPYATLIGTIALRENCAVEIYRHIARADSASPNMVAKTGSGIASYRAIISDGRGIEANGNPGNLTNRRNTTNGVTNGSILYVNVDTMFVSIGGQGFQELSGDWGHTHITVRDCYLSTNAHAIYAGATNSYILGKFDHILPLDDTSNTTAVTIGASATNAVVSISAEEIKAHKTYHIYPTTTETTGLWINCPIITSTLASYGTARINYGIDNKLDKVTTTSSYGRVYAVQTDGTQMLYNATATKVGSTIPIRTSTGKIKAESGSEDDDVVNVSQLNTKVSKSGDTMTGSLNISMNGVTTTIGSINNGYTHFQSSAPFNFNKNITMGNNGRLIADTDGKVYDNGQRVYSPNNKPTPSDIGAATSTHNHAYSFDLGATLPKQTMDAGNAPTKVSILNTLGKGYFNAIKAFSGEGDYLYCADLNPDYTITANYGSGINNLFNGNMASTVAIPISTLATTPWELTIMKNSGDIEFTNVLTLIITGHRLVSNNVKFKKWKVEVYNSSENSWKTALYREGVDDSVDVIAIPLNYRENESAPNYFMVKGIRLTIYDATAASHDTNNVQFSSIQLRDSRPSMSPALGLGALDIRGGVMYGDVNWIAGRPKVNNTEVFLSSGGTISGNLTVDGTTTFNGDIIIPTNNQDKYIVFDQSGSTHDWRIGYTASGSEDPNYFTIQTAYSGTFQDAVKFGLTSKNAWFAADIYAQNNKKVWHEGNFNPSNYLPLTGGTITGNLTINGNITHNGTIYESHAEQIYTKNDIIIMRESATGGLASGQYTGIVAYKYDGSNYGALIYDKDGVARVGDITFNETTKQITNATSAQPLATRDEANNMTNNYFTYWDSTAQKIKTRKITISDVDTLSTSLNSKVDLTNNQTINGIKKFVNGVTVGDAQNGTIKYNSALKTIDFVFNT